MSEAPSSKPSKLIKCAVCGCVIAVAAQAGPPLYPTWQEPPGCTLHVGCEWHEEAHGPHNEPPPAPNPNVLRISIVASTSTASDLGSPLLSPEFFRKV